MYRNRGNTAANPRRKRMPSPEQRALYIAESIKARIAEGRGYSLAEYGIDQKPEMIAMVVKHLG